MHIIGTHKEMDARPPLRRSLFKPRWNSHQVLKRFTGIAHYSGMVHPTLYLGERFLLLEKTMQRRFLPTLAIAVASLFIHATAFPQA